MNQVATVQPNTAIVTEQPTMAMQIINLSSDPNFDVAKLQALINLQNAEMARQAEVAFSQAFVKMQAEIPTIVEDKKGEGSTYASLETIVDVTRPILNKHGFSVTFDTKTHLENTPIQNDKGAYIFFGYVEVTAILRHELGYHISTETCVPFDFSGSKKSNTAQAQGSATSYGKRYTYCSLLNIATRQQDDDGRKAIEQIKVTAHQAKHLQGEFDSLGAEAQAQMREKFMQFFGSDDISQIPQCHYQNVLVDFNGFKAVNNANT